MIQPEHLMRPYLEPTEEDVAVWTPISVHILLGTLSREFDGDLGDEVRAALSAGSPCPPAGYSAAGAAGVGMMFCNRLGWAGEPLCNVVPIIPEDEDEAPEFNVRINLPPGVSREELAGCLALVLSVWDRSGLVELPNDRKHRDLAKLAVNIWVNAGAMAKPTVGLSATVH